MATTVGPTGDGGTSWGWILELAPPMAVLAVLNLYAIGFVGAEHTLYRADQVAYWSYASGLAAGLRTAPVRALGAVARSVPVAELNLLPALPVSLVMAVFGSSRMAYVLTVLNLYGLALVAALLAAVRLGAPPLPRPPPLARGLAIAAALLLFPTLWRPVVLGYLGLGGVAVGIVILVLYLYRDPDRQGWHVLLLLGFAVTMLALFRRWYAIWGVAFCLTVAGEAGWRLARTARRGRGEVWRALRPPLLIAAGAVGTLLLVAAPLLVRRLTPGYAQEFAAYAGPGGLGRRLGAVVAELGLLPLALVAAAVVVLWSRSKRRLAVVPPVQAVLAWLLMTRIQGHSPQHWYLYLPALLLVVTEAIAIAATAKSARRVAAVAVAVLLSGGLCTAAVLIPFEPGPPLRVLVSANRLRPLVRNDLAEVRRLLAYLDRLIDGRGSWVYVLGSGGVLSDQTLAFANRSLATGFISPTRILAASHVDRRDGFPRGLLQADVVVVPDPPQLGMNPVEQQVVLLPTLSFLHHEGLSHAFRELPERFELEGGVAVRVFAKVRPISAAEVDDLSAQLRGAHPDLPKAWKP